jgi:hypothetical protein
LGNETALIADATQIVQIPSYIGSGNVRDLLVSRSSTDGAGRLESGEYAIDYQGLPYFVGQLALQQSDDASAARANTGRYTSGHTLRLLMALVGSRYRTDVRLRVVTGVPPSLLKEQPTLREEIAEHLVGPHCFTFMDQHGTREIVMTIEAVVVMMEGVAPMAVNCIPGKPIGLIDIGGHSFDIGFLGADGKIIDSRTRSLTGQGVARVGDLLAEQFRVQHGRMLRPREIDQVLHAYRNQQSATIFHRGEQQISHAMVAGVLASVAERQNAFLAKWWADGDGSVVGADAERVLMIGGGALYFPPLLNIATKVLVPPHPYEENARSYAEFARRIEQRGSWPKKMG